MENPIDVDPTPAPVRVSVFDLAALDLTGSSGVVDAPTTPPIAAPAYVEPVTQPEAVVVIPAAATVGDPFGAGPVINDRRDARGGRRRSGTKLIVGVVVAVVLVVVGTVAYALTRDDDVIVEPPAPAAADADEPAAEQPAADPAADPAPPTDPGDVTAADPADAVTAVQSFLAVRGTDDERSFSSQGGRDEVDAVLADVGQTVVQGDPVCAVVGLASFACVVDTDQGALTFTVGSDPDDPASSGFEVIGASIG